MILVLSLLVACDSSSKGGGGGTPDDTADTVAMIGDALGCGQVGPAGGVVAGSGLFRHDIDLGAWPEALCNDGSGAIMYVRRAEDAALEGYWVIRTQGGGSCWDGPGCAARWCSDGTNFGMDKMTSTLAPTTGIVSAGVHTRRAENPLGGANHVLIYYCSSDSWSGQAQDVQTVDGDGTPYRIHFHGSDIFDAAIGSLRAGTVTYLDADQESQRMPDLDDAVGIVFAGASAGAGGVTHQLDRLATTVPGATVVGLHDSNYGPDLDQLDFSTSTMCLDDGQCSYAEYRAARWDDTVRGLWSGRVDESCLAWHPGDPYVCADLGHVVENHLSTPIFVRMDQQDPLIGGGMVDAALTVPGEGLMDATLFASIVSAQLQALPDIVTTAEEPPAKAPGFFGPSCGKHETLGNNDAIYDTTVRVDGVDVAMFELLWSWLSDQQPQGGVAAGAGVGCP